MPHGRYAARLFVKTPVSQVRVGNESGEKVEESVIASW